MVMTNRARWTRFAALTAVLAMAGCSDSANSTDGGTKQSDLTFLRLSAGAPQLCADSTGAWFVKQSQGGEDKEISLEFPESGNLADCAAGETEDFLRLKIRRNSLSLRPDGSPIAEGDSVFISVKWVGNDSILFELQPSGLQFDPANPAQLKIEYDHAGPDFNDDDEVNEEDDEIEDQLDIWRQEQLNGPFFRVGSGKVQVDDEIEARLNGFSRFALAY